MLYTDAMWFILSLTALSLLVLRRTNEKHLSSTIDSSHLAWLQQFFGMPFILATLLFTNFLWPTELSGHFWQLMLIYTLASSLDMWCYFKALSLADISYVAPLLSLVAIGNSIGAYFVLDQPLTAWGILGGASIIAGAYLTNRAKKGNTESKHRNKLALIYILVLVLIRAYYSNIEVPMLQEAGPILFNFYTSLFSIPVLFIVAIMIHKRKQTGHTVRKALSQSRTNLKALTVIGIAYTLNLLATFQAKLLAPNAGYVGAVKSAQVLPMVLIGMFLFQEKIVRLQWIGLGIICFGLFCMGMN